MPMSLWTCLPCSLNSCYTSRKLRSSTFAQRPAGISPYLRTSSASAAYLSKGSQASVSLLAKLAVSTLRKGATVENLAPSYTVRTAEVEDWWTISELHCRTFYPSARCLAAVLLRFDRVESIKGGTAAGESDSNGNFACMVACLDDLKVQSHPRSPGPGPRLPGFFRIFADRHLKETFGKTPEEAGMLGTIIVESLGQHIPPRRHKGRSQIRKGMAYICNLAVDQGFRRQGIGRTLLEQAAKVAKGWGCHAIALHCDPRNAGARCMYLQAGYRKAANEPFMLQFLEGRPGCRLELMVKTLYA